MEVKLVYNSRGVGKTIAEWARIGNMKRGMLQYRLSIGMTIEEALTVSVGRQGKKGVQ